MTSLTTLVFVYTLGGVTFLPLAVLVLLLHAYLTFPTQPGPSLAADGLQHSLQRPGDDEEIFKSGTGGLIESSKSRPHEPDVAAGYFAVCREYVPGGVNGKPPERTSPAGAVVAAESPSVYQSMYRSIFDRTKGPTIDPGKNARKARNVFFVVLRYVGLHCMRSDLQF